MEVEVEVIFAVVESRAGCRTAVSFSAIFILPRATGSAS
jgi:hypothetical protein